jgi:hypothetical protein
MKLKKSKHNKKRNTAFLYEVLVREITRTVVSGDIEKKQRAIKICKEFFRPGSILKKEKEIYDSLLTLEDISADVAEKIVVEAKKDYEIIDKTEIFNEQTKLINKINKELSPGTFNAFVQNYKDLATIAQILNRDLPTKERVLLENNFFSKVEGKQREEMQPTDNLVYKTFVKKFNESYHGLLEEQKSLVTHHALSFSDQGLSLKAYLNEELPRLKTVVRDGMNSQYVKEDELMYEKMQQVCAILESFKDKEEIDQESILKVLEIQELAEEMQSEEALSNDG